MRRMRNGSPYRTLGIWAIALAAVVVLAGAAVAAPPVVKTVPWVATNPLVPHDTWAGKTITLKGTANIQGAGIVAVWDFGDGSTSGNLAVPDMYAIQATHAYNGAVGTVYSARLTVTNTNTNESASQLYYVEMQTKSLQVEVNVAIDEGLWYLHKNQTRSSSNGIDYGNWSSFSGYYGITPANVNAFEVNGHLENANYVTNPNPYVETVTRGMHSLFTYLTPISVGSQTNPDGTFTPDGNGNGRAIQINQSYPNYQTGMFMDAVVASGTPNAVASTGPANINGQKYLDIVQDMVDWYSYCQHDSNYTDGGGWGYNCNSDYNDNSVSQWAAIGLLAAERNWGTYGITIPAPVKAWNQAWLVTDQDPNTGEFGYNQRGYYPWGPYAVTPSGMVQMVWNGIGRGNVGNPIWDKSETFIRDNFASSNTSAYYNIKVYYYGLFSFTKSMLLQQPPIVMLQSKTAGVNPIDWYAAEKDANPETVNNTNGVARTLVNAQAAGGSWSGHYYDGNQNPFETAWAIIMLNRTIFSSGAPVAVAKATPNPAVAFQTITLDGGASFQQDIARKIVKWQWDVTPVNNQCNNFTLSGAQVTTSYNAVGLYPVCLKVTDDSSPTPLTATTTITINVSTPPIPPTANAGGPYNFCPASTPWRLNGSASVVAPGHEPGCPSCPNNSIQSYIWDLTGVGNFTQGPPNNTSGIQPDVTAYFQGKGVGQYLIQLQVTDTTSKSFPSSGQPDLKGTASGQVRILDANDPACFNCIKTLTVRSKPGVAQLVWGSTTADHYNVYRSTTSGGPYSLIGTTKTTAYADTTVVKGTTYYYVVRPAALNGNELCQSPQATTTVPLQ